MSVAGIAAASWLLSNSQSVQNNSQQFRQEFQQLGQDLKSGNASAAQQDFATLQQITSQGSATSSSSNPVNQDFAELAQDLKSGNLPAAQQDYAKVQQDFQSQAAHGHHRHHHAGSAGSSQMSQLFSQLGQDLQSGNVSGAQQVYAAMQQDFPQLGSSSSLTPAQPSQSNASSVSVIA